MANKKIDDRRSDIVYGANTPLEVIEKIKELINSKKVKNISSTEIF